jgi:cell division transport system permease protein
MIDVRRRRPWWRRVIALSGNSFRLVVLAGLRSWRRDLSSAAPAIGSIALLLLLAGVLAMLGVAIASAASRQAASASVFDVYLSAEASPGDVAALQGRLEADPRVASVQHLSAEQALSRAEARPGLSDLASLESSNPFSESLEVRVRSIAEVGAVARGVVDDPAVDASDPTSYDPEAYAGLRDIAIGAAAGGGGVLLLLGLVSYAVCANSVRGIALARREEIALARLLAARRWMIRGPFVMEGVATGALAGVIAAALVAGAWLLAGRASAAVYAAVLPGVGPRAVELDAAALITAGMALGAIAAAFGVRRLTA